MIHGDSSTVTTNKRRSERVVLTVSVVVSVRTMDGRAKSEKAKTQVVNAHGGLLLSELRIVIGQEFDLTNPKTGVTKRCRVIHAEESDAQGFSVAFQFGEPAANFWPVSFPPSDWALVDS
ncbi:MAG: hypothetical protein ABLT11_11070 [Candidatus Acidiferrum sp.]